MHNIIKRVLFLPKIIMGRNNPRHNIWRIRPMNPTQLEITIELLLVVLPGKGITASNLEGSSIYFQHASKLIYFYIKKEKNTLKCSAFR